MKYLISILFLSFIVQLNAQTPCSPGFKKVDSLTFFDVLPITFSREQQPGGEPNSVTAEPAQFFDEQGADPYNSVFTPTPVTGNMPNYQIAYPYYENTEYRFAVDLRARWDIRKAYFYLANGGYVGDTIRVYVGNDLNNLTQVGQGVYTTAASGWQLIDIPGTAINVKYVMIGLHGKYYSGIGKWSSNQVNEVILYGCPLTSRKLKWSSYTGAAPRPRQPIANVIGTVLIEGYDSVQLFKWKRTVRSMVQWDWYSDDSTTFNKGVTPINNWNHDYGQLAGFGNQALGIPTPYSTTELGYRDSLAHEPLGGHNQPVYVWPTVFGANGRAIKYGEPERGFATDEYKQDPTKAANYNRWAHWNYAFGQMFGSNNGDTSKFVSVNNPKGLRFANQNIGHEIEPDNEPYGIYNQVDTGSRTALGNGSTRYQWPHVIAIKASMAYDGNGAAASSYLGYKAGDPNVVMIEPGNYFLDSAAILANHRLSRMYRTDSARVYTWGNIHWYPNQLSDPLNQYSAMVGQHPIQANYGQYVQKYINFMYSIDTFTRVMISETGFDRQPGSIFQVRRSGNTWTDAQWQAINVGWLVPEIATTTAERATIYQLKCNNCTETSSGSFQTTHEVRSYTQRQFFPVFYYLNSIIQKLQNFVFVDSFSHKWRGPCIYRFQDVNNSLHKMIVYGYADTTGRSYTLDIPVGRVNGTVTLWTLPLDNSGITSTTATLTSGGFTTQTFAEKLAMVEYYDNPPVVTPVSNIQVKVY